MRGRKRKGKVLTCVRLSPETRFTMQRLMKEYGLKETEQFIILSCSLLSEFLNLLSGNSKTAKQKLKNCLAEIKNCLAEIRDKEEDLKTAKRKKNFCLAENNFCLAVFEKLLSSFLELENFGSVETETFERVRDAMREVLEELRMFISDENVARSRLLLFSYENNKRQYIDRYLPTVGRNNTVGINIVDIDTYTTKGHRERLSLRIQEKKLKWEIEPLVEIVERWDAVHGSYAPWRAEWDKALFQVLELVWARERIAKAIERLERDIAEKGFPYVASIWIKRIGEALGEGKGEVTLPFLGKVKIKNSRRRIKISPRDVLNLWNEVAKESEYVKVSELTPKLEKFLISYIRLHPDINFWKKLIHLVPYVIKNLQDSSPRALSWLSFKTKGRDAPVLDWVIEQLYTGAGKEEKIFVFLKEELLQYKEKHKIDNLGEVFREKGIEILKKGEVIVLKAKSPEGKEFLRNVALEVSGK